MSKNDAFWLSEKKYTELLWDRVRSNGYYYKAETILAEIAVNLHEIAKQLAEMNWKKPPEDESNS